jgi:hypothetical protein
MQQVPDPGKRILSKMQSRLELQFLHFVRFPSGKIGGAFRKVHHNCKMRTVICFTPPANLSLRIRSSSQVSMGEVGIPKARDRS